MEGKIFLITYEDDLRRVRRKWTVFKEKDDHLYWFYNPFHLMKVESVKLTQIIRMEERNLEDLEEHLQDKRQNLANFYEIFTTLVDKHE